MALTATTLSAACTASDTLLAITSTSSGFPAVATIPNPLQVMQVDDEYMLIVTVPVANTVRVAQRGYHGSVATAHDILAPVITSSSASDFPATQPGANLTRPPFVDDIVSVGQNGTIAVPTRNTTILLTKATALGTTTLGAPSLGSDGIRVTITTETAAAHVITATSLVADGVSGSPHTTMTFAAFKGASITLVAANGLWQDTAAVGVTVS